MTNENKPEQIEQIGLTHSQLIKKRKQGAITEPELARLHEFEARANERRRSKERQPIQATPAAVKCPPDCERCAESARRDEEQRQYWAKTDKEREAIEKAQRAAIYPDESRAQMLSPAKRIQYYDRDLTPDQRRAFLAKQLADLPERPEAVKNVAVSLITVPQPVPVQPAVSAAQFQQAQLMEFYKFNETLP